MADSGNVELKDEAMANAAGGSNSVPGPKYEIGDRVKLADGVIKGHVAIVFHDESFEYNPYRVDWDDGSFGFYDDDELDPVEEESMPAMKNEEKAIDGTKQYRD